METIRLTGDDWRLLRDIRLAALADAPYAYGSSLAIEAAFGEADWRRRLHPDALWTVVRHTDESVGLVGAYVPEDTPMLVAMWVRPSSRGLGVSELLITDVLRWAKENRWSRVVLRVADGNDAARALFVRHGFAPTGVTAPLESDPGVRTELLARAI
jgi:GNAT superfamily N-acetyltransferase